MDDRVTSIPGHSVRPLPSACDNLLLDTDVSYLMVIKLEILMYVGVLKTNPTSVNCVSALYKEQLKSPKMMCWRNGSARALAVVGT